MKRLLIYSIPLVFLASCTKNIDELNNNPKKPTNVPGATLFSNAQANLATWMATPDYNNNIFFYLVQYWAATTYPQESQYILSERNIPRNWWDDFYVNILQNFKQGEVLINGEIALGASQEASKKNRIAITQICQVYSWAVLVNTFGNVPYTQALDYTNSTPAYDDQKTVFYALTDTLDMALASLDESAESFGSADLIYGGDIAKWIKFGNSLKLRMGIIIADSDPEKAKTMVEAAAPNAFTSNADNAEFFFSNTPPNSNPIWVNLVQSNRNDFVVTNVIIDTMNKFNDPRRPFYFSKGPGDVYIGGIYGNGNSFSDFSHTSDQTKEPEFPSLLLDYAEVEFLLAEAVERGFTVGAGTAESHYNSGVQASIAYWKGSDADAMAYLAQPGVSYSGGDWKQRIGTQSWIANYLRGFDEWTTWRRLDYPKLLPPASAITPIPVRLTYPDNEPNLNLENYTKASSDIGGDEVTTKLFWDKF